MAQSPARALELIERAIAADPADAENFGNLAFAHDQLRRPEDALTAAARAAELCPTDARLHLLHGDLALKAGRRDVALDAWARAAELDPGLTINPEGGNLGLPAPTAP